MKNKLRVRATTMATSVSALNSLDNGGSSVREMLHENRSQVTAKIGTLPDYCLGNRLSSNLARRRRAIPRGGLVLKDLSGHGGNAGPIIEQSRQSWPTFILGSCTNELGTAELTFAPLVQSGEGLGTPTGGVDRGQSKNRGISLIRTINRGARP